VRENTREFCRFKTRLMLLVFCFQAGPNREEELRLCYTCTHTWRLDWAGEERRRRTPVQQDWALPLACQELFAFEEGFLETDSDAAAACLNCKPTYTGRTYKHWTFCFLLCSFPSQEVWPLIWRKQWAWASGQMVSASKQSLQTYLEASLPNVAALPKPAQNQEGLRPCWDFTSLDFSLWFTGEST
jgi:hypothetical protein